MKYCRDCNYQTDDSEDFCPFCGLELTFKTEDPDDLLAIGLGAIIGGMLSSDDNKKPGGFTGGGGKFGGGGASGGF